MQNILKQMAHCEKLTALLDWNTALRWSGQMHE